MIEEGRNTHLTPEEKRIIARLRQGPQSSNELAQVLDRNSDCIHALLTSLDRKVGIVPLFRIGELRYGLAE
jgi:DNA-binding CsgD family transcriptional regulator